MKLFDNCICSSSPSNFCPTGEDAVSGATDLRPLRPSRPTVRIQARSAIPPHCLVARSTTKQPQSAVSSRPTLRLMWNPYRRLHRAFCTPNTSNSQHSSSGEASLEGIKPLANISAHNLDEDSMVTICIKGSCRYVAALSFIETYTRQLFRGSFIPSGSLKRRSKETYWVYNIIFAQYTSVQIVIQAQK